MRYITPLLRVKFGEFGIVHLSPLFEKFFVKIVKRDWKAGFK